MTKYKTKAEAQQRLDDIDFQVSLSEETAAWRPDARGPSARIPLLKEEAARIRAVIGVLPATP